MDERKTVVARDIGHPSGSDFAELSALVKAAGLFRRRPVRYALRIGIAVAAFGGACAVLALGGKSWWQVCTAVLLAVAYTQLAFLGHDAGHKQIFHSRRANDAIGTGLAGLVGISYGWWVGKHTRHHAHPNVDGVDPDIDIPALAFNTRQSRAKAGFLHWMAKYQAFLFFPLLLLEGLDLHWSGAKAVWRGDLRRRRLEAGLLGGHLVVYLAAVFVLLPPGIAFVFIAVHHAAWGVYMGCSFAPNHKAMPHLEPGHKLDFLRRQVMTSHNLNGGRWMTFTMGGLNYQIEHHLFPSVPMAKLRRAQPLVRDFCAKRGISYSQGGLFHTYAQVLRHLHEVGAPLRANAKGTSE
ncbi:fatty acid desaturase [Amycolatopsis sulphurea]|uniref:Fatty acid desaturase n=1 Tax=Amycolatopsis sulphurea TaxID=76022 RepID=A0A2A9FK36_9PSEU|nr:acyl-CoA desaturase [Amycolatopsis sulphurea]PFG50795.1 fatty acid desaturase [Amycolatopsis sulphurea]